MDKPGYAGGDGPRHVSGHAIGIVGEPTLEVGIDRQVGGGAQVAQMSQHFVHGQPAIFAAERPGITGTGGSQRLETQLFQTANAADVPGVGDDEVAGFVELAESGARR